MQSSDLKRVPVLMMLSHMKAQLFGNVLCLKGGSQKGGPPFRKNNPEIFD